MTKIAILTPTRGRPEQCRRMVESAFKTASNPENVRVYLGITEDDNSYEGFAWKFPDVRAFELPDYPTVHKWNTLAKYAQEFLPDCKLFMLGADDIVFETSGWDEALIDHYNALENKIHVYHLQDSRNPSGTPHPIVTREYIRAMGYFLPPIFLHWYCDTWTVDIGSSVGAFTHLQNYKLTHDKPSDTGPGDDTHNRIRRSGWRERDKYVNDTCQHFLEMEKSRLFLKIHGHYASPKFEEVKDIYHKFSHMKCRDNPETVQ